MLIIIKNDLLKVQTCGTSFMSCQIFSSNDDRNPQPLHLRQVQEVDRAGGTVRHGPALGLHQPVRGHCPHHGGGAAQGSLKVSSRHIKSWRQLSYNWKCCQVDYLFSVYYKLQYIILLDWIIFSVWHISILPLCGVECGMFLFEFMV